MRSLIAVLLFLSFDVLAIEPPSEEELAGAIEEPLDLGTMTVTGTRFTFEQETALRMVRQALDRRRSYKRKDRDEWVCWYEKPTGTNFKHLACARNGDLEALRPDRNFGTWFSSGGDGAGYGTIMRSNRPVNKKKFEAMLATLPGSADFDKEFVALALAGQNPPRDIPSDDELDSFARAFAAVSELDKTGADDNTLVAAITAEGLSLGRYNRLVDLVESFQSIENEVAYRLGTLERPPD